jgi:uncharacterized protein (TIGR03067 family)
MVVFGWLLGAVARSDDAKDSATSIRGTWKGTNIEKDGIQLGRGSFSSVWEINDNQTITIHGMTREGNRPIERTVTWKYRIVDSKKNPTEIDLMPGAGPGAGKTLKGIYAVENDVLKVAYPRPPDPDAEKRPRPTELRTKKGDGILILRLERPTFTSFGYAYVNARIPLPRDPFTLLRMSAVQKDLKLSEEQVKQVQNAANKYAEIDSRLRAPYDAGQPPRPDPDGRGNQSRSEREKAAAKILNAEQAKRLTQIERQRVGAWAFTDPELAKELGLTEGQLQSMREIKDRFVERHRFLFAAVNHGRSREKSLQQLMELEKERDGPLLKLLTPAQAKKWQELTGPPLEIRR